MQEAGKHWTQDLFPGAFLAKRTPPLEYPAAELAFAKCNVISPESFFLFLCQTGGFYSNPGQSAFLYLPVLL